MQAAGLAAELGLAGVRWWCWQQVSPCLLPHTSCMPNYLISSTSRLLRCASLQHQCVSPPVLPCPLPALLLLQEEGEAYDDEA